jgi:hypothetical protein
MEARQHTRQRLHVTGWVKMDRRAARLFMVQAVSRDLVAKPLTAARVARAFRMAQVVDAVAVARETHTPAAPEAPAQAVASG